MKTFNQALGTMLRTVRLSRNLSQKAVADRLGISRSTYTYYEAGKTSPDMETLRQIAGIFSISPADFFYPERFADPGSSGHRVHKSV